jgi:hypothetical protein
MCAVGQSSVLIRISRDDFGVSTTEKKFVLSCRRIEDSSLKTETFGDFLRTKRPQNQFLTAVVKAAIGGVPGTGAEVLVDFRDQAGGFTGKLFPTARLVDSIAMDDGSSIDVTIVDMVNVCAFFEPLSFGIGYTGLELPSRDGNIVKILAFFSQVFPLPFGLVRKVASLRRE